MAQTVTWRRKSRRRAEPIKCGLSATRWASSHRSSPSKSIASECCSDNVFIYFSAFHVQFHGQITVNSVVNRGGHQHCFRHGTERKEIIRLSTGIFHYLAQDEDLRRSVATLQIFDATLGRL